MKLYNNCCCTINCFIIENYQWNNRRKMSMNKTFEMTYASKGASQSLVWLMMLRREKGGWGKPQHSKCGRGLNHVEDKTARGASWVLNLGLHSYFTSHTPTRLYSSTYSCLVILQHILSNQSEKTWGGGGGSFPVSLFKSRTKRGKNVNLIRVLRRVK